MLRFFFYCKTNSKELFCYTTTMKQDHHYSKLPFFWLFAIHTGTASAHQPHYVGTGRINNYP